MDARRLVYFPFLLNLHFLFLFFFLASLGFSSYFFLFHRSVFLLSYSMVSRNTIDWMVDCIDNLSKVQQNPMEQATEPAPSNALELAGQITPKQNFTAAFYGSNLGYGPWLDIIPLILFLRGSSFLPRGHRGFRSPYRQLNDVWAGPYDGS